MSLVYVHCPYAAVHFDKFYPRTTIKMINGLKKGSFSVGLNCFFFKWSLPSHFSFTTNWSDKTSTGKYSDRDSSKRKKSKWNDKIFNPVIYYDDFKSSFYKIFSLCGMVSGFLFKSSSIIIESLYKFDKFFGSTKAEWTTTHRTSKLFFVFLFMLDQTTISQYKILNNK